MLLTDLLFIFINGHENKMKMIYYDGSRLWMMFKLMEKGKFKNEFEDILKLNMITEKQLKYLMKGFI